MKQNRESIEIQITTLENQLINRNTQRQQIWKAFAITKDEDTFRQSISSIDDEVRGIQQNIATLKESLQQIDKIDEDKILNTLKILRDNLINTNYEEKRLALSVLNIKVNIDGDNISMTGLLPQELESIVSTLSP